MVDQLDIDVVDQAPVMRFDDGCFNLLVVQACVADGTCRVVQMPAWSRETAFGSYPHVTAKECSTSSNAVTGQFGPQSQHPVEQTSICPAVLINPPKTLKLILKVWSMPTAH